MATKSKSQLEMEASGLIKISHKPAIDFPAELVDEEEREIYAIIVDANASAHLFNSSVAPLAVQYVRHYRAANDLADVIKLLDRLKEPRLYLASLKAQRDETSAMCQIASRLKLGGASIANHRGNVSSLEDSLPRPWEYGG